MNKKTSRKRPQTQKNRYEGKQLSSRIQRSGPQIRGERYNRPAENRFALRSLDD